VKVPVNYILLEGTDLSGKTTLYNNIHRSTGFEWNIQDRSALSMLCYARQYGRDPERWREQLREEINNLNNRHIVLMPDEETILRRLAERGDEFQDAKSIIRLRSIFEEEVSLISHYPNVLVVRTPMGHQDLADHCIRWVRESMERTTAQLADDVRSHAAASGGETYRLNVDLNLGTGFHERNLDCLEVEEEREYYFKIRTALSGKIMREVRGLNEYSRIQDEKSRRFIHAEDTCISLLHAMVRQRKLHMTAVLRSSNVVKTLPHDLDFLYLLTQDAHREIGVAPVLESVMHLSIQSAHLVP
jgi:hypothetical protein